MAVVTTTRSRARTRESDAPFAALPPLSPRQEALLRRWLASHAAERRWQTLLEEAGQDLLEWADDLLEALVAAGAATARESLVRGTWRVERVAWRDLPALQKSLGLRTADERQAARDGTRQQLAALAQEHPWLEAAVASCLRGALGAGILNARAELLQALATWHAEQRFGLRRNFAQHARQGTKDITPAEWKWLEAHVPLESVGIERLAFILWLGGTLSLETARGRIDAGAAGFCGLPMKALGDGTRVAAPPRCYWLIENRTSFERQAAQAEPGTCVAWLPGRPPDDWLAALGWLLDRAPAPARISCDPDPAGIEIALTAGALWQSRGLEWGPHRMAPEHWQDGPTLPLNAFDRGLLARQAARGALPEPLAQLRDALERLGCKAEQEAWL
ncbi:hypothetical protein [Paracidovorax anthurii]|uniref:DUF2399 domain-containing protein n=1 Tax=Paracidovorax anthurii TaxID=78229 RepID=A0A328ZS45_9BURK|nr:hypothetical protein [Paracidovorax anthurii]RAR85096.1 hypothetical protein AX018_100731 [Paracidovorax anthurii]